MEVTETYQSTDICEEFIRLRVRCRELFGDLKELPNFGRSAWLGYFTRVFDAYTNLWKLQQRHRHTLEQGCGLSRAQVGDIASKIGQLYYHYYLRTSDPAHLRQSYSFYKVIHERKYFEEKLHTEGDEEQKPGHEIGFKNSDSVAVRGNGAGGDSNRQRMEGADRILKRQGKVYTKHALFVSERIADSSSEMRAITQRDPSRFGQPAQRILQDSIGLD